MNNTTNMAKSIKIGDKKYVQDGNNFIEEDKLKAYNKRMETFGKIGGRLSEARVEPSEYKEHGQKD
jgi:hypothetical protein